MPTLATVSDSTTGKTDLYVRIGPDMTMYAFTKQGIKYQKITGWLVEVSGYAMEFEHFAPLKKA
jgi:hypothetical protein